MHAPGSNGGRSMEVEAINARVASQSGHVIARERPFHTVDMDGSRKVYFRIFRKSNPKKR